MSCLLSDHSQKMFASIRFRETNTELEVRKLDFIPDSGSVEKNENTTVLNYQLYF